MRHCLQIRSSTLYNARVVSLVALLVGLVPAMLCAQLEPPSGLPSPSEVPTAPSNEGPKLPSRASLFQQIGSLGYSRLAYADVNWGAVVTREERSPMGFEFSGTLGVSAAYAAVGFGSYSLGSMCNPPVGFSLSLIAGRSYWISSAIPVHSEFAGVQAKATLIGIPVRLGWVTAVKRGTSTDLVNFEVGLGI